MVVAAFVAPYLLEATARFVAAAAALPGVRLGLITCDPLERIPPHAARPAGRALAGRRRARPAADRRGGQRARPPDGPGRAPGRRARAAPGAARPGARGAGHRGHGRADRAQRAGQVADEDGAPRGRRALRRARAGAPAPAEATRVRAARSASRWSPSRRPAPARRRPTGSTTPTSLEGWLHAVPPSAEAAGAARGVPRRRGAHLRQRHDRRPHRLVVDRRLPAAAAGGPAQPVDPVDGAAPARHLRTRVRRHPRGRPGRAARARGARRAHPHGVVPPAGRLGRRCRRSRRGRPARS